MCSAASVTSTVLWWWITHFTTKRNEVGILQFLILSLHFTRWYETYVRYTASVISSVNGEM